MTTEAHADDPRLKRLLREARPPAELPVGFAAAVWRRIEHREAASPTSGSTWWARLAAFWLEPRRALVVLGVAALLGAWTGWLQGRAEADRMARARYVATVSPIPSWP